MNPNDLPDIGDRPCSFDSESSGLFVDDGARVSVVSVAWRGDNDELCAHAFPFDQGKVIGKPGVGGQMNLLDGDVNLGPGGWRKLAAWLQQRRLIAHDMKHDCHMMAAGHRVYGQGVDLSERVIWDTELASWILDPLESRGLGNIAKRAFGGDKDDGLAPFLKKNGNRYDLVPWDVMEEYAEHDARLTLLAAEYQWDRIDQGDDWAQPYIEHELKVARTLFGMEQRGIGYDVARSMEQAALAKKLLAELDGKLPFSPPTPNEAKRWFFGVKKGVPHCVTEKRQEPSVSECCVRSLIKQRVEGAETWAARTKVFHSVGKYYDGFVEACGDDGRLRTKFQQMGTITFRFSSQRINLQALPHDYRMELVEGVAPPRSLFIPRAGCRLYEMDLGQAELRDASKVAGCRTMADMLTAGDDIHAATAKAIFGSDDFEHRQVGKRSNFALIYTVGPRTFRADVEKHTGIIISEKESKSIIDAHHKLYPEFPIINRKAEAAARRRGYVKLCNGRKRWFQPYEELHKAFNARIQGDISQIMGRIMVQHDQRWPETLLLQVHDSLVVEVEDWRVIPEMCEQGATIATDMCNIKMILESKPWK